MINLSRKIVLCLALVGTLVVSTGANWGHSNHHRDRCCKQCCEQTCCCPCPPPPVEMVVCLQDPCGCCTYEACVCVPACCAGQQPCVTWRGALAGRKVATLCWECCGHEVKVVVTRNGVVRVRG